MATIGEINQTSSYSGNAAIGGAIDAPVVIDPSPVQRYATFKFYADQAKWQQKQIDDANAANQIASVSAYDITSPLTQYSDALKSGLKDLQDTMTANPKALNYSSDPEGYIGLQKKINSFANLRKSATASGLIYNARKDAADQQPDLQTRDLMNRKLDQSVKELFDHGVDVAQNRILSTDAPIKPDNYKIPVVAIQENDIIQKDPNETYTLHTKYVDGAKLDADSNLAASGLKNTGVDKTTDAFKNLSPERQQLEIDESAISNQKSQVITDVTNSFNDLLPKYIEAHPGIDISKITGNANGNDTILDIIASTNYYNQQFDAANAQIARGELKDPTTGKVVTVPYTKFNLNDGLSPAELIKLHSLQSHQGSIINVSKTITNTNDATDSARLVEQRRHNKAAESIDWAQLKDKQDQWKAKTSVGGETVRNAALERAKRIYSDLQGLTDVNGVITPDKVKQLNTEQLKYLGVENVTTSASGVEKLIFKPLDLNGVTTDVNGKQVGDKIDYAIQLVNGKIMVMKGAKPARNGKFGGDWDNTKSTNVFNVATNIVNEELTKAGSKELNSYTAIDLGDLNNGSTTNNTTTTTTTSSSKSFDKSKLSPLKKNGVTYYVDPKSRKVFDENGKPLN